jgi:hypothetical protein
MKAPNNEKNSKFLSYFIFGILTFSGSSTPVWAVRSELKKQFAATIIQRNFRDHRARKAFQERKAQQALAKANEEANEEQSHLLQMPDEILALIASHLNPDGLNRLARTSQRLRRVVTDDQVRKSMEPWPNFAEFDGQFVTVPEGFLPNDSNKIASFEAVQYPAVTEKLWLEIMGSLPMGYQAKGSRYPITRVNWENKDGSAAEVQEFLAKLNEKTARLGCTYDLPTDRQLQYLLRGDETGINTAKFMMATRQDGSPLDVNDNNLDDYIWHFSNSDTRSGRSVQPMETKKANAFGIERPSVWMMSKDLYDPVQPVFGRTRRGGSFYSCADYAESQFRSSTYAGYRHADVGFALIRTCE